MNAIATMAGGRATGENAPSLGRLRADFPYLEEKFDGKPFAYLDSGASAQKPRAVIERISTFLEHEYANVHRGIHTLSERATNAYEGCRDALRKFIHAANREEIIFTSGTTAAVNLVARSWGEVNLGPGDMILLTEAEHHSNLLPWQELARRRGAEVRYVPVRENGAGLDAGAALTLLAQKPKLFAFAHVSNTLGIENPVADFCAAARRHGVTTFVDAAQSVGHQPVDVRALDCDFLACSAHKMCGPSGIGMLYGRAALLEAMTPWMFGGEMVERSDFDRAAEYKLPPARFEAGTPPILETAGWHEALRYLEAADLRAIQTHSIHLAQLAWDGLCGMEGVHCFGPERRQAGLVTFKVEGVHAHDIAFFCNQRGVAVRAGHHCAQPLMRKLGSPSSTRASFYLYNTEEEVTRLVAALRAAITFFKG